MKKGFTRTIEDFTCEHCGYTVTGNGYTNHCPECLWSKHVDKNPGDREEECKGMMEPIGTEKEGQKFMICQRCIRCGFERRNTFREGDNFDTLVKILASA